jgi:hypothetical protein
MGDVGDATWISTISSDSSSSGGPKCDGIWCEWYVMIPIIIASIFAVFCILITVVVLIDEYWGYFDCFCDRCRYPRLTADDLALLQQISEEDRKQLLERQHSFWCVKRVGLRKSYLFELNKKEYLKKHPEIVTQIELAKKRISPPIINIVSEYVKEPITITVASSSNT